MRIDPNVVVFPITNTSPSEHKPRASERSEGASVVSLSSAAEATQARNEAMTARLERIRGLIDRGEYPIDLDLLSARIVDDDILRGSK